MGVPLVSRIRGAVRELVQKVRRQYFVTIWQMNIGKGSVISFSAKLDKTNPRGVHIGEYTVVTFGAAILTHDHVNNRHRSVHIGNNCFIGAHSIILPGVRIGDNCVVGAASVVARDLPAGSLVVGNPARVLEANIKTGHYGVRVVEQVEAQTLSREANSIRPSTSAESLCQ
jgi:acetyltransferase-like isoleucine patch superfamily enzyme